MIKAIIFDFDGVLAESAHIKTEAFGKLFSRWPDRAEEAVAFHLNNAGISRYVKFKHFYENILGEPYTEDIGNSLGKEFSEIVLQEIKNAPLVTGTESFLNENQDRYLFFIASGTPQDELVDIVSFKKLERFFKGIFGTPATKKEIVERIMRDNMLEKNEIIFIGDAESDMAAAEETGTHFVLRDTTENKKLADLCANRIDDLTELGKMIKEI